MPYWEFKDYVTEDHLSPLVIWYGSLDPNVKAAFDLLLKNLAETEDWDEAKSSRKKYKELKVQHAGLCELRFKVGPRSFRPLGVLQRELRFFVLLGGAEKIGQDLTVPEGAFDEAFRLMGHLAEGRGAIRDYNY
jgi:hypothetical protein